MDRMVSVEHVSLFLGMSNSLLKKRLSSLLHSVIQYKYFITVNVIF